MRTPAGRLLSLAFGFALLGSGAAILAGNAVATLIIAFAFPVSIAVAIVAVAMASVDSWSFAVAAGIGLPVVLFAFAVAVFVLVGESPLAGYLLIAAGAAAHVAALRGNAPEAEPMRTFDRQPAH